MKKIDLVPELIKQKIENHFDDKKIENNIQITRIEYINNSPVKVRFEFNFNLDRKLVIDISANGNHEHSIKNLEGTWPIHELNNILTEYIKLTKSL